MNTKKVIELCFVGIVAMLLFINTSCAEENYQGIERIGMDMGEESINNQMNLTAGIDYPTIEEARAYTPDSFHYETARSKDLIDDSNILTDKYLRLQAVYKLCFNSWLDAIVSPVQYELEMTGSEYTFSPKENQSIYKKYGCADRQFIFLRNNFHIEKLDETDISLLQNVLDGMEMVSSDVMTEMIGRTFVKVITVDYDESGAEYDVVYDPGVFSGNKASNKALVFGIQYDWEFDEKGNLLDGNAEDAKEELVISIKKKMEIEISEKVGIQVVVFF